MKKKPARVLVVATSPPPYGGQAMMVQTLLNSEFENIEFFHVRMAFSSSMQSMGRFEVRKVFHMVEVVAKAWVKKFRYKTDLLYYVPGGSGKAPVIRDIFILFFLKLICPKVVFHFHAAGVSEVVERLPGILKKMAIHQYSNPDLAIFLSGRNPDNVYFKPKSEVVIPNGLQDAALNYLPILKSEKKEIDILFVGVLKESKGVMTLLEAVNNLKDKGYALSVTVMGEFSDKDFSQNVHDYCQSNNLNSIVHFPGVLLDGLKWAEFARADIFCFPSFFESESFGNVLVEAMMFELPVVSTNWRGIPDIVEDGVNGFLVPIQNSTALTEKLEQLIKAPELRREMGKNGRYKYLNQYNIDMFVKNLQTAFNKVI